MGRIAEQGSLRSTKCFNPLDVHQPGIRIDSSVYAGYRVLPFYDSLIAKLIAHGRDREEAVQRLARGLEEYIIGGIETTIPLHQRILKDPAFVKGRFSTQYLDDFLKRED